MMCFPDSLTDLQTAQHMTEAAFEYMNLEIFHYNSRFIESLKT